MISSGSATAILSLLHTMNKMADFVCKILKPGVKTCAFTCLTHGHANLTHSALSSHAEGLRALEVCSIKSNAHFGVQYQVQCTLRCAVSSPMHTSVCISLPSYLPSLTPY